MSAAGTRGISYRGPMLAVIVLIILGCGGWWGITHRDAIKLTLAGATPAPDARPIAPIAPQAPLPSTTPTIAPPAPAAQERPIEARPTAPPPRLASSVSLPAASPAPATPPPAAVTAAPAAVTGTASAPTSPGSRARLELVTDNVQAVPADGVARVMVRRTRSLRGEVSFSWWTESGTAKPGRDFTPVAAHVEQIADGRSAVNLVVPIIADPERQEARNFYVVIDEADPTAAVGPRTLTMVTIPEL